jgi:hypothetical protein
MYRFRAHRENAMCFLDGGIRHINLIKFMLMIASTHDQGVKRCVTLIRIQ